MAGGVTKTPTATTSSMIGYGWRDDAILAERVSLMAAPPFINATTALSPEPDCRSDRIKTVVCEDNVAGAKV